MAKKKKASPSKQSESPSFEQALTTLQDIVSELEQGTIGLEDSMRQFETGVNLLRTCYDILAQAEQKIEVLTGIDAEGNPTTNEFDASATADTKERSAGKRKSAAKESSRAHSTSDIQDDQDPDSTLF